jgi:hypothetical protein
MRESGFVVSIKGKWLKWKSIDGSIFYSKGYQHFQWEEPDEFREYLAGGETRESAESQIQQDIKDKDTTSANNYNFDSVEYEDDHDQLQSAALDVSFRQYLRNERRISQDNMGNDKISIGQSTHTKKENYSNSFQDMKQLLARDNISVQRGMLDDDKRRSLVSPNTPKRVEATPNRRHTQQISGDRSHQKTSHNLLQYNYLQEVK